MHSQDSFLDSILFFSSRQSGFHSKQTTMQFLDKLTYGDIYIISACGCFIHYINDLVSTTLLVLFFYQKNLLITNNIEYNSRLHIATPMQKLSPLKLCTTYL